MAYVGRNPPKLHLTTSVLATPEKSSITILLMIIFKRFFSLYWKPFTVSLESKVPPQLSDRAVSQDDFDLIFFFPL